MTVHKSQGTTLKRAVVDLRGCSQKLAYTAVSRVSIHDLLGVLNLTRTVYDRLTRTTKEDQVIKEFYTQYVGINIPKNHVFISNKNK